MNSNYPRANEERKPVKQRVFLSICLMAICFQTLVAGITSHHPVMRFLQEFLGDLGTPVGRVLAIASVLTAIGVVWRNAEWKIRKKIGLVFGSSAVFLTMMVVRDAVALNATGFKLLDLILAFFIVAGMVFIFSMPIWITSWLMRRKEAKIRGERPDYSLIAGNLSDIPAQPLSEQSALMNQTSQA